MQLHYSGQHLEITPPIKAHADAKLEVLGHKFQQITHIYVIFKVEKDAQIAEATAHIQGLEIHAEASTPDLYQSINAMTEKLSTQLEKHKEKQSDHHQ
jgi:putative sigma-54 modulation protein